MKIETAAKTLRRHGWVAVPDQPTAGTLVSHIRAAGDGSLNGERLTKAERTALRTIADGEQPHYHIESAKGNHDLAATNRADAIREAREWQREMQAAFADLVGPRGGKLRL